MDPHNGEADEYGVLPARRQGVDPLAPDLPSPGTAPLRMTRLVSGEHLVTVNPLDGSEIELCPPGEHPPAPVRLGPAARAEAARLAAPEPPPGAISAPPLPLMRDAERARVLEALQQGRSVRLTGPSGSGRTSFLEMVAADCDSLAPDGVVRLNGFRRGADELLRDLAAAVHDLELHRLDEGPLRELVSTVAAVVFLDDLEFGGADLDELLAAAPESVFVLAADPAAPDAAPGARLTEIPLRGLDRTGGQALLERTVGRALDATESVWTGDLWFESEGLPLRFAQAGALLRLYDLLNEAAEAGTLQLNSEQQEPGAPAPPEVFPTLAPTLAEGVAPVAGLVAGISESARAALRFAVALDGEMPHASHLPALVGDTHADAALAELLDAALLSRVGSRHRLAAGVRTQLVQAGYAEPVQADRAARAAAHHYAWWAAHPSVAPRRVAAESGAVLAALAAVVPQESVRAIVDGGEAEQHVAVQLARTVAPVFAAALEWGAWERSLRLGLQAARAVGAVADEAYFRHELGILALCAGRPDRARTELQGALDLRGALADKRGTVAARRALALVADKDGSTPSTSPLPALPGDLPRRDAGRAAGAGAAAADQLTVLGPAGRGAARSGKRAPRRNLVAVGAGTLLVAVVGAVVALGATSSGQDGEQGTNGGTGASEQPADPTFPDNTDLTDTPSAPASSNSESPSPSASSSPPASASESPDESPSESQSSPPKPTPSTSKPSTPTSRPTKPTPTPTPTKPSPTPTPTESDPGTGEPDPPDGSGSMSAPASSPGTTSGATTEAPAPDGSPAA